MAQEVAGSNPVFHPRKCSPPKAGCFRYGGWAERRQLVLGFWVSLGFRRLSERVAVNSAPSVRVILTGNSYREVRGECYSAGLKVLVWGWGSYPFSSIFDLSG